MGIRLSSKLLFATGVSVVLCASVGIAASETYPEHEVKAAFLYNFMRFTDWPEQKVADANEPLKIFVVGEYPQCKTFENIQKKGADNQPVLVRFFNSYKEIKDPNVLKTCHVLFVCSGEKKHSKEILAHIKGSSVLAVGEFEGFLEAGGMINFVRCQEKIGFEINLSVATESGLKFRSKLLRLAKHVMTERKEN